MPARATETTYWWNESAGGTSRKSTWTVKEATGEVQPALVSVTESSIVAPGSPASKVIWLVPWPPVTVPPVSVQVQVEPGSLTTLAALPVDATATETGVVIV